MSLTIIVHEGPGPAVAARWVAILRQQEARKTVILDMSVVWWPYCDQEEARR